MSFKRVTIITRTKNRTVLLRRAIESILSQSYSDWLHVIVNDGGDPAPVDELVNSFKGVYQGRLKVIHNAQSLGMEAASNVGIRASSSEFIAIHDDDDSWQSAFLERSVTFLDTPPPSLNTPIAGVVSYSTRILEEFDGQQVRIVSKESFNTWMTGISLYRLASSNTFPPISFVFSRSAMDEIGLFREDLPVLGDWDFHLRFAARYEIGLIREELANYHHRISLQSGDYGNSVIAGNDNTITCYAMTYCGRICGKAELVLVSLLILPTVLKLFTINFPFSQALNNGWKAYPCYAGPTKNYEGNDG
jgi:glycosyltransferase involved in cell wall biosynthesis